MKAMVCDAAKAAARGAGQVMFMQNAWTGLLFVAGIAAGSWLSGSPLVALGALAGLASATVGGRLLCSGSADGAAGLWGFNGILVGCALPTFFAGTACMWVALVLLSALSPLVRVLLNRVLSGAGVNSLTFPFIVLVWLSFALCLDPRPDVAAVAPSAVSLVGLAGAWLHGVSQVFLVCSPLCGVLFLAGLAVADRRAAVLCALGSAAGMALAFMACRPVPDILSGLYGFNPALTAIALGAVYRRKAVVVALGVVATFFVQVLMSYLLSFMGVPALTAPFCVATWVLLLAFRS